MQAPATPSRLLLIGRLHKARPATELAAAVTGTRNGRSEVYALYDHHVAELLDQTLYRVEHLRWSLADVPTDASSTVSSDVNDSPTTVP